MNMYRLVVIAFVTLTTAAPVAETHSVLATEIDCQEAVSNLNIQGILMQFGSDDKLAIYTAMKSAAKVQCGVLTGDVVPDNTFEECEERCGQLNIEGILQQFGADDKVSIWRAMKGACYGECGALFKQGAFGDNAASVRAAITSSDDAQQIVTSSDDAQQIVTQGVGEESECQGKVADLNIEGILTQFGSTNKKAIWTAMKQAALTQCYINANQKVYKPSGESLMICKQKCGNLNIEGIQQNFGKVNKRSVFAAMKSACFVECDNIYTAV